MVCSNYTGNFVIIIVIISIIITYHLIYNYIPEANHVSRIYGIHCCSYSGVTLYVTLMLFRNNLIGSNVCFGSLNTQQKRWQHLSNIKVKVKWSRYRPGVAKRASRGIALLFHDRGTWRGWVVSSTSRPHFTPGKDPVPILQDTGWAPGPVWTGFVPGPSSP